MNSEDFKKLASFVAEEPTHKKVAKTKRLLSLNADNYQTFQRVCREKGQSASEVINNLIAAYIETTAQPSKLASVEKPPKSLTGSLTKKG